ncbi:hypothetical protein H8E77_30925 [bacterium]|nr:hypothetical protein [bacterium]
MDIDQLTQIIEAEVRKALSELDQPSNPPRQVERKKILAVFTSGCTCQNIALTQIEQLIAADYDVTAVLSPIAVELMVEHVKNIKGISAVLTEGFAADISNMVETAEVIVVPLLSRTAAAKLALGIADELALMVVMQGLITGKSVIAAKNSADPQGANCPFLATENTPSALIQLAKNYLKTLESFGMKLVDVAKLTDVVMNKPQTYSQISDKSGKPLITQTVIAGLAEDVKTLTIPNPAIITPLAYDLAKARGIEIVMVKR